MLSRIYRMLIRLYPRSFRETCGADMIRMFNDMVGTLRRNGLPAVSNYALRTYLEVPVSAFYAHQEEWTNRLRPSQGDSPGMPPEFEPGRIGQSGVIERLAQDLKFAVRSLTKSPGFTAVAIITLALGIGANTALYSVVNGVLLRPLPYEDPDQLVLVWNTLSSTGSERTGISQAPIPEMENRTNSFDGFAAAWAMGSSISGDGTDPQHINLSWVTPNYFDILGVDMLIGRRFRPEDKPVFDLELLNDPNFTPPPASAVLSHAMWQQRFGGDPDVLGRVIQVNGQSMEIIGVARPDLEILLPEDVGLPTDISVWTLVPMDLSQGSRSSHNFAVVARMKDSVGLEAARADLARYAEWARTNFEYDATSGVDVRAGLLHAEVVGHVRPTLLVLLGAVGFVLLIACVNVANLLLARAATRDREMAIKMALGGGRSRILSQALMESTLLSVVGATLGVLIAAVAVNALPAFAPEGLPRMDAIGIDGGILALTAGIAVVAAFVFGAVPALASMKAEPSGALRERSSTGSKGKQRARSILVIGEVAISLVLLVGAGLMLRTVVSINRVQHGFEPSNVLTAQVSLPFFSYLSRGKRIDFFSNAVDRIAQIPGVEAAGGVSPAPLSGIEGPGTASYALEIGDETAWATNEADYRTVVPGNLQVLRTALLEGRLFERSDNLANSRPVVIVDRTLARELWPGQSAVGQLLWVVALDSTQVGATPARAEVIGVVEEARYRSLTQRSRPAIYLPYQMFAEGEMTLTVRTTDDPARVLEGIREVVAGLDPELPVFASRSLSEYVDRALGPTTFALTVIGLFAAMALLLAAVGLYGVIAYMVRQRVQEIGIRMAFGASRMSIARLIISNAMGLTALGLLIGIATAAILDGALSSVLYGVEPGDPLTIGVTLAVMLGVAIAASILPARRAMSTDPIEALRTN